MNTHNDQLIKQLKEKNRELERTKERLLITNQNLLNLTHELKKSEQELRDIFENIQDVFFRTDMQGNIQIISPSIQDYGYHAEELIGINLDLIYANAPEQQTLIKLLKEKINLVDIPVTLKHSDGTIMFASMNAHLLVDKNGSLKGLEGTIRNITKRKLIEDALALQLRLALLSSDIGMALNQSSNFLDALKNCAEVMINHLDAALAWIWTLNKAGSELELQASAGLFTHIAGIHARVPMGRSHIGLIAQECKPYLTNDAINDPDTSSKEWIKREGIVGFAGYPLTTEGRLVGVMAIFTRKPITETTLEAMGSVANEIAVGIEYKRAEERIHRQAALLNVTKDAILVRDLEHKVLLWNDSAERIYGWSAQEVLGKKVTEFLFKEVDLAQFHKAYKTTLEKGEWTGELHQVAKNGKEIIVESRWTLVFDGNGKLNTIFVANTNITDKKRMEAQFLRAQRIESIGTLAGGIAHDLNNVLAPILMLVQLLKKKLPDEQSQRMFKMLENSTERGAELIKQVLSFARGIEGERTLVQVKHIIADLEKVAKQTFPKSIWIYTTVAKNLQPILGDATQLHQVLMNILVNARDAMPKGGSLNIEAENILVNENFTVINMDAKIGPHILITISDTGIGILPENLDRIFEPFFTTKELGKGTGLGLSTSIGIVKSHGGFINVYSEAGKGTQFKIYLPTIETAQTIQSKEESLELPSGEGELILVIDDEVAIRDIMQVSLEAYNYQVLTASDGAEALAIYVEQKNAISLVITDMMMPIMDGMATIRALQKINPQVQIIATSGISLNDKSADTANLPIYKFLLKPCTPEILLTTIHQAIKATKG